MRSTSPRSRTRSGAEGAVGAGPSRPHLRSGPVAGSLSPSTTSKPSPARSASAPGSWSTASTRRTHAGASPPPPSARRTPRSPRRRAPRERVAGATMVRLPAGGDAGRAGRHPQSPRSRAEVSSQCAAPARAHRDGLGRRSRRRPRRDGRSMVVPRGGSETGPDARRSRPDVGNRCLQRDRLQGDDGGGRLPAQRS